ncbi:hypothetical protein C2E23DRAFT_864022 [Lenzites betulinus]|nr:hypothetical protein C2E23DRAFT_864022 [Lenzites betulinus]
MTECCCNSAAFQLHMLCLNCQIPREKRSDQPEEPQNATWTEYTAYFKQCPNGSTEGTPPTSPAGNAKQVIASMPFLMDHLPFESGWSYFATKEAAGDCSADANNISSPTPSSTLTNPVSLPTHATSIVTVESLTSTATSTGSILGDDAHRADVQSVPPGAIAGIVVAVVVVIGLLSVGLWYMRRQRRKAQDVVVGREIAQMTGNSATVPTRKRGAYLSMSFTPLLMRRRASSSSGSDTPPPITFHPDAMVRRVSPMPFSEVAHSESLPGYAAWDAKRIDEKLIASNRTDLRVRESMDESPNPFLPIHLCA